MKSGKIKKIQLFGERCSGTNYAAQLFNANFPEIELTNKYGFKHRFHEQLDSEIDSCLFVVVYRDVFDWLRSFHLKPYHAAPELRNIPFSDFIRKEWRAVYTKSSGRTPDDPLWGTEMMFERCPETGKRFSNVLALREARTRNWECLSEKVPYFFHVRYEDLRQSPQTVIEDISSKFGIRKETPYQPVLTYKGKGKKAYKKKTYKAICKEDIEHIVQHADLTLEQAIGYNVEQRKLHVYIEWLEEQLVGQQKFLEALVKGSSFKVGRMMTWPMRVLLNKKRDARLDKYWGK